MKSGFVMGGYPMEEIVQIFLNEEKEEEKEEEEIEFNRERSAVVTSIVDYLLSLGLIDRAGGMQLGCRLIELLIAFENAL